MSFITTIEETLRRAVHPLPRSSRAMLESMFRAVLRKPVRTMRTGALITGLQDLIAYADERGIGGTAVEVGSYAGESTEYFARHFRKLHAVDPWLFGKPIERAFDERMRVYSHVQKWKMTSALAAAHFADASLDFVYIDADHQYTSVRADLLFWMSKLKNGGLLAGHDYGPHEPGVMKAVEEILGKPDRTFADTSWVKTM